MKISVIVPAFNEEKLIETTLSEIKEAAKAFAVRSWEFELVVCDNNSTDRTAEIARAAGARVVFEVVNQIALARNAGAAVATGDWLIFIDADTHPSAGLFDDVAGEIESGKTLAGGVTLRLDQTFFVAGMLTGCWNLFSRMRKLMAGAFIFVEAAVFRQMGGFHRELYAGEEIELSSRLKRLAQERRQKVVVLHRHPITTSARKLHLYSNREILGFLIRSVFRHQQVVRNRDAVYLWYDGRR